MTMSGWTTIVLLAALVNGISLIQPTTAFSATAAAAAAAAGWTPRRNQQQRQQQRQHPPKRSLPFSSALALASMSSSTSTSTSTTEDWLLEEQLEATVLRYFQGVDTKNATQIRECFDEECIIRDVCALTNTQNNNQPVPSKTVQADAMVERCMDFIQAHPDVAVHFHIPPTCLRRRKKATTGTTTTTPSDPDQQENRDYWVFAHWYETGTWSGTSCGLTPSNAPMNCEGQTRFRLDPHTTKIQELVVTRTFTQWECAFLETQAQNKQEEES